MKNIQNQIIENYINAYNSFDIESMLSDLDNNITFENVSNGETDLTLKGIEAFKKQAEQATLFFSKREQKITGLEIENSAVMVDIDYTATLAQDLQALKAGESIKLNGKSIFHFNKENKIIKIQDIS
ncbi:nuclear transport factor 2 family protein [Pedobacter sp. ISL-68]|uniref:nuclear transport factor 2 family protein n=1 Tax=Pedobacter sp. ISL-68 TaxID=2819165 RepID=UPI001BECC696|nr:nuclear transport factor 2 family protein [Pedobacter sp. ISL-68]MBT2591388.1 nuclear transport factor 2 family protein [Pedobacter sp. ISL-68]